MTEPERETLINWVRGQDNDDENMNKNIIDARASIHGDVLHSRPVVINYTALRATTTSDLLWRQRRDVPCGERRYHTDGNEMWAFVPSEFYSRLKRLRDNSPAITARTRNPISWTARSPSTAHANQGRWLRPTRQSLSLHQHAAGRRLPLCAGRERSGCAQGALEEEPQDTGYGELGQTWSEPKVVKVRANCAGVVATACDKPVLIFGAGYDAVVEDQDPIPSGTYPTKGRGILVVDATNGNVLWQAGPSPTGATVNKTVRR